MMHLNQDTMPACPTCGERVSSATQRFEESAEPAAVPRRQPSRTVTLKPCGHTLDEAARAEYSRRMLGA